MPESIERVFALMGSESVTAYRGNEMIQTVSWVGIFNHLGLGLTMSQVQAVETLYNWLTEQGYKDVPLLDPEGWFSTDALAIIQSKFRS